MLDSRLAIRPFGAETADLLICQLESHRFGILTGQWDYEN